MWSAEGSQREKGEGLRVFWCRDREETESENREGRKLFAPVFRVPESAGKNRRGKRY